MVTTATTLMEYEEESTWPLTSPTTCYTGIRRLDVDHDNTVAHFATAVHAVSIHLGSTTTAPSRSSAVSWQTLAPSNHQNNNNTECVGYSRVGDWEAYVLLDVGGSSSSSHQESVGVSDDSTTTASASTTTTSSDPLRRSLQSSSVVGGDITSPQQNSSIPTASSTLVKAQLVLRRITSTPTTDSSTTTTATTTTYSVALDHRPLAPTLWVDPTNRTLVGVWMGSADHPKLQLWYVPLQTQDNPPLLQSNHQQQNQLQLLLLDHPAFQFESPIMGLDGYWCWSSVPNNPTNISRRRYHLVVTCQDGTIRLISIRMNEKDEEENFVWNRPDGSSTIRETTLVVDGPNVCVRFVECPNNNNNHRLQLIVGSLCGYVFEMFLGVNHEGDEDDDKWEGPFMVADGFWNDRLHVEDSVLAVDAAHDDDGTPVVAIGLHSGRCLVYRKVNGRYELHWHGQLNYSVHAVVCLPDDALLVTTRRSVHLLKGRARQYDPDLAKKRLDAFIRQQLVVPEVDFDEDDSDAAQLDPSIAVSSTAIPAGEEPVPL